MAISPVASKFRTIARIRMCAQKDALFISEMPEMDEDGLARKMVVIERIAQAFMVYSLCYFQDLGQVLVTE